MGIAEYITKWRHTRGYGVHSPLAYQIVKECLYPDNRYGFYSDAYIDYEFRNDREKRKEVRRLIRLINLLKPKRVWIPNCDKRVRTALSLSFPRLQLTTHKECPKAVDMIVDFNDSDIDKLWNRFEGMEECTLISFASNPKANLSKFGNAPTLTMQGKSCTLLLRRKSMTPTSYLLL